MDTSVSGVQQAPASSHENPQASVPVQQAAAQRARRSMDDGTPEEGSMDPLLRDQEQPLSVELLQQKIAKAKAEKEQIEAECRKLRGGGAAASEGAALQVPMPTRLLQPSKTGVDKLGSDLAQTRGTLEQLMQKVDQLCNNGPRTSKVGPIAGLQYGSKLSPEQPVGNGNASPGGLSRQVSPGGSVAGSLDNYSIKRDESREKRNRGGLKRQESPGSAYDIQRDESSERKARVIARDMSQGTNGNTIEREESAERAQGGTLFDDEDTRSRRPENEEVLEHSIATKAPALQGIIYVLALGGIVFTLVYPAIAEDDHRRLGGGGGSTITLEDGHGIIIAISYSTLAAGLLALIVSFLKQPLLLGYILAGFLVGPEALVLVEDHTDIKTISELGLVLLLFMIGLELDLHELLKMGKVVLLTGAFQFPVCASIHLGVFTALSHIGLSFGTGDYAVLYVSFCCGISSTMIVVKLLSEKMETDTTAGRLTIGILIFQDIWAIVMLAIQPNMAKPEITGLLKTFGFMGLLIVVAFSYSKYVLPAVFMKASSSPELMLILALAWCFFVCAVAILSFVGLSMELAALIAGVSMATFPYNAELNGKVKYIRDYFITLYFVALGMQIPMPTPDAVGTAVVICVVVLLVRWIGIYSIAYMLGGGSRLAILSTVNLSEVSEFGLVLCSIGIKPENNHINQDTLTIQIWTFAILAIAASYFIGYNHTIFHLLIKGARKLPCSRCKQAGITEGHDEEEDHEERDIIILGFHKIAAALIAEFEQRSPMILWRLHVIDHKLNLADPLRKKHITFSYGDITSPDVLEHAHHGNVDLVLLTMPDYAISGVTNVRLLEVARQVWPKCHIIVIADDPKTTKELYNKGANYVVATKKLSAERIADMLTEHYSDGLAGGELRHHLEYHRENESVWNPKLISLH